jgi:hypothetical protein
MRGDLIRARGMLRRVSTRSATAALLAIAATAAGCGGEEGEKLDACALLPEAEVARVTGEAPVVADPEGRPETCDYALGVTSPGARDDGKVVATEVERVDPGQVAEVFEDEEDTARYIEDVKKTGPLRVEPIGELGDRAALYTPAEGRNFMIVAANDGDVVRLRGYNVSTEVGEMLVRRLLGALERTR